MFSSNLLIYPECPCLSCRGATPGAPHPIRRTAHCRGEGGKKSRPWRDGSANGRTTKCSTLHYLDPRSQVRIIPSFQTSRVKAGPVPLSFISLTLNPSDHVQIYELFHLSSKIFAQKVIRLNKIFSKIILQHLPRSPPQPRKAARRNSIHSIL